MGIACLAQINNVGIGMLRQRLWYFSHLAQLALR
jgi:hypothetical protein